MIDFGPTASDYARFRVPFSSRLIERLSELGIGRPGQELLDVGAGTGLLGAALSTRGAEVTSVDLRFELLERSHRAKGNVVARAESLPFADAVFDVVTAAQCWHWFDRRVAPREIRRVLRPGGIVAVVYQTYIPLPGSVAERTEQLILQHRSSWRHANSTGINGQVLRDLQINGFGNIESFSFDVEIAFSRESWRGFIRTTSAVGASMSAKTLAEFDAEHVSLLKHFPEPFLIPHRIFCVTATRV